MIAEARGPGTGVASAELSQEELDRLVQANAPKSGAAAPVLKDQAIRSVFQEVARVCSQLRCTVAFLGPPGAPASSDLHPLASTAAGRSVVTQRGLLL